MRKKTKKKIWLAVAIILSTIAAVVASIWLIGGRLLWIKFVMYCPFPDWLKSLLWGWGL